MENFKEVKGKQLRRARKSKGFATQQSLAQKIGADRTRVSRWESGENIPDPAYQDQLISLLGLPKNFFDSVPEQLKPSITVGQMSVTEFKEVLQSSVDSDDARLVKTLRDAFGDETLNQLLELARAPERDKKHIQREIQNAHRLVGKSLAVGLGQKQPMASAPVAPRVKKPANG